MTSWKRLLVVSAGFGAGFAICAAAIVAAGYWYSTRPKPWNATALRIGATKAEPVSKMDANLRETGSGILFTSDVENTTESDVTLPQDLVVMQETKSSHALHKSFLKLDRDYFIPAHHTVTVSLSADDVCAANFDPRGCFHACFEDDQEIVLFDNQNRYEVHIPMPALTVPKFEIWKPAADVRKK
jgi:hypothetical protein